MKRLNRLQFRHRNEIFENRAQAAAYFEKISNDQLIDRDNFGESLYAEPLVAKYFDEEGKQQIIFAIGVDSGYTKYHIIDSKEIAESIEAEIVRAMAAELSLSGSVDTEIVRAMAAELSLSGSVDTEIVRAMTAELSLSGSVDTERAERIAADTILQSQITNNVASIVAVNENLDENVLEEYVLKNAKGEELGEHIKIYKDSSLVGAEVNWKGATGVTQDENGKFIFSYTGEQDKTNEYLYLIYRNENGGLNLVGLDFENFLMENEEGDGIKIVDHKITIKIKNGEKYLQVTADGLQTIAIDEAIKEATDTLSNNLTAKLDAEIARSTTSDEYISGLTSKFSAATVAEFILTNSAITVENKRAMAAESSLSASVETETERALKAELFLSGSVDTERAERISEDNAINQKIAKIKDFNSDLNLTVTNEITRATTADSFFENALTGFEAGLQSEIKNRSEADTSVRNDFIAADNAIYNRIDSETNLRSNADIALGNRIDTEISSREEADSLLSTRIISVSDRVNIIESDYLTNAKDRYELQQSIDKVEEKAEQGVADAAKAQETANDAKEKIDSFLAAAEIGNSAIDTLIELQNYIKGDETGASEMLSSIEANRNNIIVEQNRAEAVEAQLDTKIGEEETRAKGVETTLNTLLATETERAKGAENANTVAINNEVTRATNAEQTLSNALNTEITNRIAEDASVRQEFAIADNNLSSRIDSEVQRAENAERSLSERLDNSIADVLSLYSELGTKVNTETANRESADNAFTQTLNSTISTVNDSIQNLTNTLQQEVSDRAEAIHNEHIQRTEEVNALGERINNLSTAIELEKANRESNDTTIQGSINVLSGNILTQLNITANDVLNQSTGISKTYTDETVTNAIGELNSKKVTDVAYDNGNKKIYLTFADSTRSEGFDASEFVVDGMLDKVEFNDYTNEIKFIWNTASEKTEINVPLDKFVDQYKVADDSVSYLKISDDNKISAIVDGANNYVKTLATNVYVEQKCNEVYNNVNESMSAYVTTLESKITALENKITTLENNMEQMVKDVIKSYLVGVEKEIAVNEINGKLTVGFSDDAIFGEF